jgi:hypothetical protein
MKTSYLQQLLVINHRRTLWRAVCPLSKIQGALC